jgi:site-specific recombinase
MTHRAYGFTRLSAERGGLLSHAEIAAVRAAADESASARAVKALDIDVETKRFQRLLGRYRAILKCYQDAVPLVRALLGLHEIENVKLGWRAVARRIPPERWTPLWRDLHELARVSIDPFRNAHTLFDVVKDLDGTLFGGIASDVYTAHADDLASAELAFDRWASLQVVGEIEMLDRSETLAAEIAEALVRLRDDEIARRSSVYGLSQAAAEAARAYPRRRAPADLQMLCRRAFRGQALRLAPAIAYAALTERDDRIARALAERGADADLDPAVDRIVAWAGGAQ